jgi:hypothetical protein
LPKEVKANEHLCQSYEEILEKENEPDWIDLFQRDLRKFSTQLKRKIEVISSEFQSNKKDG